MITDFRQQLNELKNAADKEEYAKQLANIFLTGNLDLKTILLMAMDYGAQSRWISVEDELPKNRESTLFTDGGCVYSGRYYGGRYYGDKGDWVDFCEVSTLIEDVTHWMPMPQVPVLSNSSNIGKDLKGGES